MTRHLRHLPVDGAIHLRVVAVVQARMTSSRLPGKALIPLRGRPVLGLILARLARARRIDSVIVATSSEPSDDILARWCEDQGVACFRGDLADVLGRFRGAAARAGATHAVRITADCPLVDPEIVDRVIEAALHGGYSYCGLSGGFPDGLDCEVMTAAALKLADENAQLRSEREHVTPYLKRPDVVLRRGEVRPFDGLDHLRWTLDRLEDLRFLEAVLERLARDPVDVRTADVLDLLEQNPDLLHLNAGIVRNEGYLRSREQDAVDDVRTR